MKKNSGYWELLSFQQNRRKGCGPLFCKDFKKIGQVIGGICLYSLDDVGMTSPPHLECWAFDYLFWRDSIAATNLLHSVQGAIQEKSLGILDSNYLRVLCPSYAITAPVTGHVLWIEGSFWRYRNEVSPREVTSPSLTNANLTLSSSFVILNNSAKPSSIPCCTEHENLPFPLVKRCQEFLGVHGRTSVFRQKRNSNSSRNGSRSLLVLTLVEVCFKNSKLNSLK